MNRAEAEKWCEVKWAVLKARVDMASDEMKPRSVMMCCAVMPSDGIK